MPKSPSLRLGIAGDEQEAAAVSELYHINGKVFRTKYFAATPNVEPPEGAMVLRDESGKGAFWIVPVRDDGIRIGPCDPADSA